MTTKKYNNIEFTSIKNDVNGNPRYVFHFKALADIYTDALRKAKKLHYKAYRGREYGGMLVVSTYNLERQSLFILMESKVK